MDLVHQFAEHIRNVQGIYEKALSALGEEKEAPNMDAVLIHSGSESVYFADDHIVPFQPFGQFSHWAPVHRPDQMILMEPGRKPLWFHVVSTDYWFEQVMETESWWTDAFRIIRLDDPSKVMDHLPASRRIAFLGENTRFASDLGLPRYLRNEPHLTNYLDYHRGMKTAYEVARIKEANRRALISHQAALAAFEAFGSEWDIHMAYLDANQLLEYDTPYPNIVALDEKSAILHYQNRRRDSGRDSRVLLIDAGYRYYGYCSDITRTWCREHTHPVFKSLRGKMDQLQLALVDEVKVGVPYAEIHDAAHKAVLDLLIEHDICSGSRDALKEHKISKLFFPHGIGHLLGIQVHDVGGYFKDETGALAPPPEEHKSLRLNRPMTEGMVFTIEPGLYFIPVLLDPERDTEKGAFLNWDLIDALIPLGGIRIEDNIHLTADGPVNLTR